MVDLKEAAQSDCTVHGHPKGRSRKVSGHKKKRGGIVMREVWSREVKHIPFCDAARQCMMGYEVSWQVT